MYYACALMVFGGLDTTPLRSLISKMVEPMEYGKIFTFVGVGFSFAMIITNSVYQEILCLVFVISKRLPYLLYLYHF